MNSASPKSVTDIDRILVVDDLFDNYVLLQTILENEGYQVEVADSGRAALEEIASNPPN